jgi:hypothetical protein
LLGHSFCRDGCIEKMRLGDAFENCRMHSLTCVWYQGTRDLIVTLHHKLVGERFEPMSNDKNVP